jgi:hypothetical protein
MIYEWRGFLEMCPEIYTFVPPYKIIYMKNKLFLISLIFLFACNDPGREAQSLLENAKKRYENAEYNSAKQLLDEVKKKYPKEVDVLKESLHLMRQIDLKEQERNLLFCDSMLLAGRAQADSLRALFTFEKDPQYDTRGKYTSAQPADSSPLKIQTGVYEDGEIYLQSLYTGTTPLLHNCLKVSLPSGEYARTEIIPRDGGANYSFQDDNTGLIHETVTYQNGKDNGVIPFIYNHSRDKLTLTCLGGKTLSVPLARKEAGALVKCLDFSLVLKDIQQLQREKIKAEERIKYLREKIH